MVDLVTVSYRFLDAFDSEFNVPCRTWANDPGSHTVGSTIEVRRGDSTNLVLLDQWHGVRFRLAGNESNLFFEAPDMLSIEGEYLIPTARAFSQKIAENVRNVNDTVCMARLPDAHDGMGAAISTAQDPVFGFAGRTRLWYDADRADYWFGIDILYGVLEDIEPATVGVMPYA